MFFERKATRKNRRAPRTQLGIEVLEDRRLLAVSTVYWVNTTADVDDPSDTLLSLREAIRRANESEGADTIRFENDRLSGQTIELDSRLPPIVDDLTIRGLGADQLTVKGPPVDRILTVIESAIVGISGLTLRDAATSSFSVLEFDGGAIFNSGLLTIVDCKLLNNAAGDSNVVSAAIGNGGAIFNEGTMVVDNTLVAGNVANLKDGGGAIYNAGSMTIVNSTLAENSTVSHLGPLGDVPGGAIYNAGDMSIQNSTISGNQPVGNGGGVFNAGTLTVTETTFSDNVADHGHGGGIYNAGALDVTDSTFTQNIADGGSGGAAYNAATMSIDNSLIFANQTTGAFYGGGGLANSGSLTVTNSTITGNFSENNGAGIASAGILSVISSAISGNYVVPRVGLEHVGGGIQSDGIVLIANSTISGNVAEAGGGLDMGRDATGFVTNSAIFGNSGGGIRNRGELLVVNSTISRNRPATSFRPAKAGGIWNEFGSLTLRNATVTENRSVFAAGGISSDGGTVTLNNTIVAGNFLEGQEDDVPGDLDGDFNPAGSHNLVGVGDFSGISAGVNGNLVDQDPRLEPLADNGGPTRTYALMPSSPAVDAGDNDLALSILNSPLSTDQRGAGFPRIVAGTVDIGAYELAPNTAPRISAPAALLVDEDHTLVFSALNGNSISVSDLDAQDAEIQLVISAVGGTLTLADATGITFGTGDGDHDLAMTFIGSQSTINQALVDLKFEPVPNYNGPASVTVEVDDQGNSGAGGPLTASHTISVMVEAVNDAPVNTFPAGATGYQNVPLAIGAISVFDYDADEGTGLLQVTLAVHHGTLSVAEAVPGGLAAGDISGNGTASVTLTGTQAAINATLAADGGLVYLGNVDFHGIDTLTVATNDLGNAGAPGPLADSDSLAIHILSTQEQIEQVGKTIEELVSDDVLGKEVAKAVPVKLAASDAALDRDQPQPAIKTLDATIHHLDALHRAGKLDDAQVSALKQAIDVIKVGISKESQKEAAPAAAAADEAIVAMVELLDEDLIEELELSLGGSV